MLNNVKTLIYIITGEYAGIQEICEAFETEEEQHKAFEEKTGFTWEQYLDGEYNFDSIESTDYFYRCFEVELQGAKTKGEQVTLLVDIECYDRSMTVVVSRLQADQAAAIMGEHYNTWIEEGFNKERLQTLFIDICKSRKKVIKGLSPITSKGLYSLKNKGFEF